MNLFCNKLLKLFLLASCLSIVFLSFNKLDDSNPDDENAGCNCDKKYGSLTDKRDQHIYKTLTICTQTWMAENLAYLPKLNSLSEISESKPRYYFYNNDGTDVSIAKISENYKTYGVLYNWPSAMRACPKGWHLPCDKEWVILEEYLISNGFNFDNTITGNKIAKSLSASSGWESDESSAKGNIGNDQSTNNRTLFSALPGGHYEGNRLFIGVGRECRFWSKKS